MFLSFDIKNFRSFRSVELSNLSRINVFFGKNNCGKTSLLESLLLLSGMTSPDLLLKCNFTRNFKYIKDFSFFFHNFDLQKSIMLESKAKEKLFERSLTISYEESNPGKVVRFNDAINLYPTINSNIYNSSLVFSSNLQGESFFSKITLKTQPQGEKISITHPKNYKEGLNCIYLASRYLYEAVPSVVSSLFLEKQEKLITNAIQLIDSRIKDFIISNNEIMVDIGLKNRIPLNFLGDGVRKFFSIIVSLYNSQNGILLIDEIDNGLHYSVMSKLWKIIIEISALFNVQVFATTHNIDSLKGLDMVINDESDVSLYKIVKKNDGETSTLYYDAQSFKCMINSETEIR